MHLKYQRSLLQSSDELTRVTAICWSPNGKKLAVCTTERVVILFDENGEKKDKFATKPADKGPKSYVVKQMAFSPQSDKLAIAQSDNMVFVYKLGSEWGDKKSICNKFQHSSSITCLHWPVKRPNELVYGLAEGKVKIGLMKTHKPSTLYQTESYVTAICNQINGNLYASAHLDGSIYTFSLDTPEKGATMIARHSCVPFALSWPSSIVVSGNNSQVVFYDEDGTEEQVFDFSSEENCKEFTVATSNPSGDTVILGNFNSLYTFEKNKDTMSWENKGITSIENLYSVTTLSWKPDGDKLIVGSICGTVDLFDICLKKSLFKGGFEVTYVSTSQLIVRQISTNLRIVIRSQYGREITKINIYKSRYVVANTSDTLLLGDLETLKISEIQWHGNGIEKFIFDNPSACMIYFAGEISIVEYGVDEIIGSVRTSFLSSHVISLRINERNCKQEDDRPMNDNKKISYLLDSQTICIRDLLTNSTTMIPHDSKIDWLELNSRGNILLFRDKRRYLHLFHIDKQIRHQLLNFCTYVQWVPNSDVIVAQNRNTLCVWYNIHSHDQITMIPIKGEIEDIERSEGRTEVVVDEGINQAIYPLDESLISFGTALEDNDYLGAMEILDKLQISPDVEAMWRQLKESSLIAGDLKIVQRCSAALGDISMCSFIGNIQQNLQNENTGYDENILNHYEIRSKLSLLKKDFKSSEMELLNQGKIDECIQMYQRYHKFDEAIRIAEETKHPETIEMRQAYLQYLLESNQYEQAALLKIKECDFFQSVNLFLQGGMPGKAAHVIIENDIQQPIQLIESVTNALSRAGMHEKAGEFYERLNESPRALDSYIRGFAFRKAVELARKSFPGKVVELQEMWGDFLVSQKNVDMAINHYIEAKVYKKAIEAALNSRQFGRALQLVDAIDSESAKPYYRQLARYYEDMRQFDQAEKCFVAADQPQLAVEMHTKLGNWEQAHKLAMTYMSEGEVGLLYINQAQKLENKGRLKDAEKLYLAVKETDLAINMYKKHRRYDDMIRLVQEYRADLLRETHQFLAQSLEMEGSLNEAEHHYVEAQEWHSAVNMYRSNEMWDDAIRVAKFYGGIGACKRVTIALLMALGVPEGTKYLLRHGLVEAAIEHASENGAFDLSIELASQNMPKKLPDIHLKHALFLEDDERFKEAEEEFLKANKPKEAIDMYVHQEDWNNALRVAENFDPSAIPDILIANSKIKIESKDFKSAEDLLLNASRPDLALNMYRDAEMWNDAMRIAQLHLPHKVAEINSEYQTNQARAGKGGSRNDFLSVGRSLEQSNQWNQAIDAYLNAKPGKIESIHDLIELWEKAIEIARTNVPNRYVEVSLEVSQRLVELKREELAADLLFEIGRHDEAISLLLQYKKFDKAKMLAKGNSALRKKIEDAYQNHLISKEDTKELVDLGKSDIALDVLAKKGDWNKLWEVADKERLSLNVLGKYTLMRVEELLTNYKKSPQNLDEAVNVLLSKFPPLNENSLIIYRKLVSRVLSRSSTEEVSDFRQTVKNLREVLYKLAQIKSSNVDKGLTADLMELLMVVHYQNMFYVSQSLGLKDISAKCAITLLKYPELLNHDKSFYQAGIACRDQGNINLAFMLLNRYVDISEAIDNSDINQLDNYELHEADAIPLTTSLPVEHYLVNEADREEIRTWILSVVTDSTIDQKIPSREMSRNTLYEGLFHSDRPICIVTGYPIHPADLLEVNNSTANRRDWNVFVSKVRTCPWTGQPQNPLY